PFFNRFTIFSPSHIFFSFSSLSSTQSLFLRFPSLLPLHLSSPLLSSFCSPMHSPHPLSPFFTNPSFYLLFFLLFLSPLSLLYHFSSLILFLLSFSHNSTLSFSFLLLSFFYFPLFCPLYVFPSFLNPLLIFFYPFLLVTQLLFTLFFPTLFFPPTKFLPLI